MSAIGGVSGNRDKTAKLEALDRSQATIEFNMDGTIIKANQNFLNAAGYSLHEIQGKHHSIFVDPEYAKSAEYSNFWHKLGNGEFHSGEFPRYNKQGEQIWIQASYNPLLNSSGRPYKVVKFAADITAQKNKLQNTKVN